MHCVLRVDRDGIVRAANDEARQFLGPCVGRRCCDVVSARDGSGFLCGIDCSGKVASGEKPDRDITATVRGEACRVVCTRVDGSTVVVISRATESEVPIVPLSPRERDVLRTVAMGHTNEEIAEILGISQSTVRSHIDNARAKLGATNRAHAIAIAVTSHQI